MKQLADTMAKESSERAENKAENEQTENSKLSEDKTLLANLRRCALGLRPVLKLSQNAPPTLALLDKVGGLTGPSQDTVHIGSCGFENSALASTSLMPRLCNSVFATISLMPRLALASTSLIPSLRVD